MDIKTINPWFKQFVIFMCYCLKPHLCLGADRVTVNQPLIGRQTIVSAGGVFTLGFFQPGISSTSYIGIWYSSDKVSQRTVVWVANRQAPVLNAQRSELRISNNNLVLFNEYKTEFWSTGLNFIPSSPVEAVLLDSGNLVLRDGSNSSEPLWQSFDNPTNTFLPDGKIGMNKITGRYTILTSWKSKDDPAPGHFSFEIVPNGTSPFFILRNMSVEYWSSGSWNGVIFSLVPEMRRNYIFNYSYVKNDNESYFTYNLYDNSIISRFVLDVGGQIQQLTWLDTTQQWNLFWSQPRGQPCETYDYCGKFGTCRNDSRPFCHCLIGFIPKSEEEWSSEIYYGGCVRKTSLPCENASLINHKSDRFFASYSMITSSIPQVMVLGSAAKCESACLSNCSCNAYAYNGYNCSIWNGDLLNFQQLDREHPDGMTLYVRLAASEFLPKKNITVFGIVGVVIGTVRLVVIVVLLGLALFIIWRRKRRIIVTKVIDGSLRAFRYRDLQNATKNFSNKLGEGVLDPSSKGFFLIQV